MPGGVARVALLAQAVGVVEGEDSVVRSASRKAISHLTRSFHGVGPQCLDLLKHVGGHRTVDGLHLG